MAVLVAYLTVLTLVSRQGTEELLGSYLSGLKMKIAALVVAVALAFGLRQLALSLPANTLPLPIYDVWATAIFGVFAGLGSNVWHLLLDTWTKGSSSNDVTITGALKSAPTTPTPTPKP